MGLALLLLALVAGCKESAPVAHRTTVADTAFATTDPDIYARCPRIVPGRRDETHEWIYAHGDIVNYAQYEPWMRYCNRCMLVQVSAGDCSTVYLRLPKVAKP